MVPCYKLLRTKSRNGIDIPLNTRVTVEGQVLEVWGLVRKEVKQRAVVQWWIVSPVRNTKAPPSWTVLFRKE